MSSSQILPTVPSLPIVALIVVLAELTVRLQVKKVHVVFTSLNEHAESKDPSGEEKRIFELLPVPFQLESVKIQNETVTTYPTVAVIGKLRTALPVFAASIRIDAPELRNRPVSIETPPTIGIGDVLSSGFFHWIRLCPGAIPFVTFC